MDLSKATEAVQSGQTIFIAFSGGADSVCLLHQVCSGLPGQSIQHIQCLHVDHKMDEGSSARALKAKQLAQRLGVQCRIHTLKNPSSTNKEAWARKERYAYFQSCIQDGDLLATAHHANDVAETLMLRMLRGSGIAGLSGIREYQGFDRGNLWRPLLGWSKQEILEYVQINSLEWVEDPSNACEALDRNFVRHVIMPSLTARFPGAIEALNRSARLNRQASIALEELLREKLQTYQRSHRRLSIETWNKKSPFEQQELIRMWCLQQKIPPPPGKPLESFVQQIKDCAPDRLPQLQWGTWSLYCYQKHLWLTTNGQESQIFSYSMEWEPHKPLQLPQGLGTLDLQATRIDQALSRALAENRLVVASGKPGERLIHLPDGKTHSVGSLLSKAHIPPWERAHWPRIWLGDELIALGDRWQHPKLHRAIVWETNYFGADVNPLHLES